MNVFWVFHCGISFSVNYIKIFRNDIKRIGAGIGAMRCMNVGRIDALIQVLSLMVYTSTRCQENFF
jgi:hypothetical protein